MAIADTQPTFSAIAGATFASGDLYKLVSFNSSGHAILGGTTADTVVLGTLLTNTETTSAAGVEAVTIGQLSGVGKVRMAASTLAAGDYITSSTAGFGVAASTDGYACGQIIVGTSGDIRVVSAVLFPLGPQVAL